MGARTLVIEDTHHNMELLKYILEARGHTVIPAMNGYAGVEAAGTSDPDVVILDLQLPDIDGFEVLRRLHDNVLRPHVPVIAVTAYAMVGDRERILSAGFDGYISKPIEPDRFIVDFERYLPETFRGEAMTAAETQASSGRVRDPAGRRGLVLAVDNVDWNVQLVRSVLESQGYAVWIARSASEALHLAHKRRPDLVISDIHMDGGSGFDLFERLRAEDIKSTFLFHSATRSDDDVTHISALGAAFLERPVDPETLIEMVNSLLTAEA